MKEKIINAIKLVQELTTGNGIDVVVEVTIDNLPIPVISEFFETTDAGEPEENFTMHSKTEGETVYSFFRCRVGKTLGGCVTLTSVLFNPKPRTKNG